MMTRAALSAFMFAGFATLGAKGHGPFMPGSETNGLSAMVREIYGGSKLREFVHKFLEPIPDRIIGTSASPVKTLESGLKEQTFISAGMPLPPGHITNKWLPIDWPHGHIAVKSFVADVVKAGPNGEAPAPDPCCDGPHVASHDEVFMHHWTVNKWQLPAQLFEWIVKQKGLNYHLTLRKPAGYIEFLAGAGLNSGANGPCWDSNLHLYFGIGNEVRGMTKEGGYPYEFPEPYGVEFDGEKMRKSGEFMVLNTHLIDTRGVQDKRGCTECKCSLLGTRGFLPVTTGGLTCCHSTEVDGGKCPSTDMGNQTYYIRYTIRWRDFNPATVLPLEVITFDATDNNTKWGDLPFIQGGFREAHEELKNDPESLAVVNDGRSGDFDGKRACHVEYYVPPCGKAESCIQRIRNSWTLPYPIEIVFLRNHFHTGGMNMTTWGSGYNCTGHGTYDSGGALRDISTCVAGSNPVRINQGDTMFVEATYSQDDLPHYGVMAMAFVYAHVPRLQDIHV